MMQENNSTLNGGTGPWVHTQEAEGAGPVPALAAGDRRAVTASEGAATATASTARCTTALDLPVVANATDLTSRKRFLPVLDSEDLLEVSFDS